jgi:hypothetical protein
MEDIPEALEPRSLATPRSAAAAGLVFAFFFGASILLARSSTLLDPSAQPPAFMAGMLERGAVALFFVPIAGIAFLWFIGVVRDLIGVREDKLFATVFLGSGILFVAMLFGAAAVLVALNSTSGVPSRADAFGASLARAMLYVYGARAAGVFTLVTSTIILRTGATSRWLALVGFALGLALFLTISFFDIVILLFPVWVALVSIVRLLEARDGTSTA